MTDDLHSAFSNVFHQKKIYTPLQWCVYAHQVSLSQIAICLQTNFISDAQNDISQLMQRLVERQLLHWHLVFPQFCLSLKGWYGWPVQFTIFMMALILYGLYALMIESVAALWLIMTDWCQDLSWRTHLLAKQIHSVECQQIYCGWYACWLANRRVIYWLCLGVPYGFTRVLFHEGLSFLI